VPKRFCGRQRDECNIVFQLDVNVEFLLQKWLESFVELLGYVKRHTLVFVDSLRSQVMSLRNSSLDLDQPGQRLQSTNALLYRHPVIIAGSDR
jgi:hypothetical protein